MNTDNGYDIQTINAQYGTFLSVPSAAMNKDMPVLVFAPKSYDNNTDTWPVLYLLHGVNQQPSTEEGLRILYGEELNLLEYAEFFQVLIVIPHVGNTYYLDSPEHSDIRMATFCGEELPIYIDTHYRTQTDRSQRFIGGFSMGGYGAVSLLCKYPETFSVALSRGGALDPAYQLHDKHWDEVGCISETLGNYWDHQERYHQASCETLLNHIANRDDVAIVQEVGREDFLYKTNARIHKTIIELNIPHIYTEVPGGHTWNANSLLSLLSGLQNWR